MHIDGAFKYVRTTGHMQYIQYINNVIIDVPLVALFSMLLNLEILSFYYLNLIGIKIRA